MAKKYKFAAWFQTGEKRKLTGIHLKIFYVLALILAVYQIWSVIWGKLDPMNQMALHLSFVLALTFLLYSFSKKSIGPPTIFDVVCAILAISAGIYFTYHAAYFSVRIPILDPLSPMDIFFGLVFVLLSMEAARRTIGYPIIVLVLISFGYVLWGHFLPGLWQHRPFTAGELLEDLAFSFNGLWGSPISVAATFVFIFMLFGAFLKKAGAGEFFFKLSMAIAGRSRGGSAKVAVIASALFGSISGSPTANTVTTGSFTIPVNKRAGYTPTTAAAVEAAASTGGSILPPIMGSAAFLMAAVTQFPYATIMVAAIIPGILYYITLYCMVHFQALRSNIPTPKDEHIPKLKEVWKEGWYYFIPLIVLVVFLFQGYSASRTGFYGILSIIAVSWFRRETRMGLKEIGEALVDGARSAIPVSTACAAAGLMIAGIMTTGLGGKLTSIVLSITEGMFFPTLVLVMVICIILGMGMPVAAAYILTAMLAAPALIELGVSPLAAHLFIVYFSIFSAITPPVAVAAYAAAGIAQANPNQVGLEAVKIGIVGFIVPFMFVLEPGLLMQGSVMTIVISAITAAIGVVSLSAGIIGWFAARAAILHRSILIISGCTLIYPDFFISASGLAGLILVFFLQKRKKEAVRPASDFTGAADNAIAENR